MDFASSTNLINLADNDGDDFDPDDGDDNGEDFESRKAKAVAQAIALERAKHVSKDASNMLANAMKEIRR